MVHLASPKHVEAVKQAPATMLGKARELAKAPAAPGKDGKGEASKEAGK